MPEMKSLALSFVAATLAALTSPVDSQAQGSLGTQGFGYPVSGVSIRVAGTAGALADSDPISAINPAALGGVQRIVFSAQAEPEYRTLQLNGGRERTTIQRIPLITLLLPAGHGVAGSLSMAGFLDRSFSTVTTGSAIVDGQTVPTTDRLDMRGGISDMSAALGWEINSRAKIGVAGHLFTGENVGSRERRFADTLSFGSVLDSARVRYAGTALSIGGEVRVLKSLAFSGSVRAGQTIRARIRDSVASTATIPDRIGLGMRYDGIAGTVFSVGVEHVGWSKLQSLGSNLVTAHDAMNVSAGLEVRGPAFRGYPTLFRAGYSRGELPFSTGAERVRESRIAGGFSIPIARDAASIDFSVQRAGRTLINSGVKESAYFLGVGVQIRP